VKREPVPDAESPLPDDVRAELESILASAVFIRSPRLSSFLRFIVERTLDGDGSSLKEQVIASELYGKGADYDPSDPIVRIDARRLRDRLREYYASVPGDSIVIAVPKGAYTPTFTINSTHVVADAADAPAIGDVAVADRGQTGIRSAWIAGAVAVASLIALIVRFGIRSAPAPPVRLITATAFPGLEGGPSFSPDGNFIAFTWTGPDFLSPSDVWVKPVEGDALRRLTDTPDTNEVLTSWSPDGLLIAFARTQGEANQGVYVMSSMGGSERKIADWGWSVSWLPDSQSVIVDGISNTGVSAVFHQVLATGERRQLTTPPDGFADSYPTVSPDGKRVAFVRSPRRRKSLSQRQAALFVVSTNGGEPMELGVSARILTPPAWTPDSREILYTRVDASGSRIFRVAASGGTALPAAGIPTDTIGASVSRIRPDGTFRVALVSARSDAGLRMMDLQASPEDRQLAWTPFCDSTRLDWPGHFSKDGARFSFTSDRNGPQQVFTTTLQGADPRVLTGAAIVSAGFASWSPDGESLVFDAVASDNTDGLSVVRADGGALRRLSGTGTRDSEPEWSRDGRWIYYTSEATGRPEIWKIPSGGGSPIQMTTEGGSEPHESPDGRSVYFIEPIANTYATTRLKRVSTDGHGVQTVLDGIWPGAWDVTNTAIVFLTGRRALSPGSLPSELYAYSLADRTVSRLGELAFQATPRGYSPPRVLSVSPDGRWAVVSHMDNWQRDIIVADGFR
jgi:Tol biopolymer transport system component